MIRGAGQDDICAYCDEFSVRLAAPEFQQLGMGRCGIAEPGKPHVHVEWNGHKCVSYRLDRVNIAARRRYADEQRLKLQQSVEKG